MSSSIPTRFSAAELIDSMTGQTAESIAQSFPVLRLEQVYGAIAHYLSNRQEIDSYLQATHAEFESLRRASREADPMFYKKLADARQPQT
jgi:hypothetical protein